MEDDGRQNGSAGPGADNGGEKRDDHQLLRQLARRLREGQKMVEIFGLDDAAMTNLELQAYRLYRNGRFGQAQIACRGVLALDADRPLVCLLLGDMALEEYRFADAIGHLERAHELAPKETAIQARLGEALLKRGDAQRAIAYLRAVADDSEAGDEDRKRCRVLLDVIES